MTDYKRITKWEVPNCASVNGVSPIDKDIANAINRLAELEDLIENGTLIDCPYKLGTELHFIVFNLQSCEFDIFTTEFWRYVSQYKDEFGGIKLILEINDVDFDNYTWIEVCHLLNKAEAEAKLAELRGGK